MEEKKAQTEGTLLFVDDNPRNLQVLGAHLHNKGYKIAVARDGKSTLRMVPKLMPDLILLDIMMPEMDGFEVCRHLKADEQTKNIPIIFLTAKVETDDVIKGLQLGAVDYITKPFKKEELIMRVRTHVELKKSREVIEEQSKHLQAVNATKDKLFSLIAHDLRGPIGNLQFFLDIIQQDFDSMSMEKIKKYLEMLGKSTHQVFELLEDLLTWSRTQTGSIKVDPIQINITDLSENIVSLLEGGAKTKGLELTNNIREPFAVYADKNMTQTVIRNIISNAIKFTNPGGKITVNAKHSDNFIIVWVNDTGIGIAPDDIQKLFDQTQNFTTYGTAQEKGTGLGLSMCKSFVEANGGKIWVDSKLNIGTSFFFQLPISSEYLVVRV